MYFHTSVSSGLSDGKTFTVSNTSSLAPCSLRTSVSAYEALTVSTRRRWEDGDQRVEKGGGRSSAVYKRYMEERTQQVEDSLCPRRPTAPMSLSVSDIMSAT
ncbi:hypothetical protein FPV67DRAFT_1674232 [Lyophyllum atratum]|nr:hypothetical protein FPV67DRAFT_1674232 [Lyophyllum atratum]